MANLSPKAARFVEEYIVDLNGTQAAIRAGFSAKTAYAAACRLLTKVEVQAAIEVAQAARSQRTNITQDMVLQHWWDIATADPNELVEYRRTCCRHCWGIGFRYQWTEVEYEEAAKRAKETSKPEPDCAGGLGFDVNREPNPKCPDCGGRGKGLMHVHDTRKLRGAARRLYAGVKRGKDGLEVKMHDQMRAMELVAKHLGMLRNVHEIGGLNGGPIPVQVMGDEALRNLTDEQLAQLEAIATALAGPGADQG